MPKPLPDIVAPDLAIIFAGLNPGLGSAMVGHHFANRSNRFWKVLHLAGFTPTQLEPADAFTLPSIGIGLTTVVARATRGVDDLDPKEFIGAAPAVRRMVQRLRPKCLAFLGKGAYCAIVGRRNVEWGAQPEKLGTAIAWVLPNPSGRNLAFSLDQLVESYRPLLTFVAPLGGAAGSLVRDL